MAQGITVVYYARAIGRLIQLFLVESPGSSLEDAFPKAVIFAIEQSMNAGFRESDRTAALDLLEGGWKHGELLRQWRNN
jgi:hypothetical protein